MTPITRSESEPIVVHAKEAQAGPDILERTQWVYGFSSLLIILGVTVGLLFDILVGNNNQQERLQNIESSDEIVEGLQFLRLLPLKWIAEKMAEYSKKEEDGESLKSKIRRFIKLYNIDLSAGFDEDLDTYKTFEQFFTRHYNDDYLDVVYNPSNLQILRELDSVLSPVEGRLVSIQKITSEKHKEYIKKEWYSAKQFLGFNPFDESREIQDERISVIEKTLKQPVTQIPRTEMYMCVLYLAPGDYHRFHAPADFSVVKRIYYSGNYYPVRPSYFNFFHYKSLLGTNERVVLSGEWRHGFFSMIPVAATNVGSIHLTREPEFENTALQVDREVVSYPNLEHFTMGDEIGHFSLGSTVVLIFEYPENGSIIVVPNQKIRLGQPLIVRQRDHAVRRNFPI